MTHSYSRSVARTILLLTAFAGALVGLGFGLGSSRDLIFSHRTHVVEEGIDDCTVCHERANASTMSADDLSPEKPVCANCHDVEDEEQCRQCHARTPEIGKIKARTRAIVFDHASHLALNGVTCSSCHVSSGQYEDFVFGEEMMLEVCLKCHSGEVGPGYCRTCHSDAAYLDPPESHSEDFRSEHGRVILAGLDTDCSACHGREQYCSDCHQPVQVVREGVESWVINEPSAFETDEPLVISRVHELNYRYTHPLDAAAKASDCTICHVSRETCNECHSPDQDPERYKPLWHSSSDWVTETGGLHSELAERDIERCVACHDAPGVDPICIACHHSPW